MTDKRIIIAGLGVAALAAFLLVRKEATPQSNSNRIPTPSLRPDRAAAYENTLRVSGMVKRAEQALGAKLTVTSGLRSITENDAVGGAAGSLHLTGQAVDISVVGHNRAALLTALRQAGFTGFGFYVSHIHADIGPRRTWFGSAVARALWNSAPLVA